MTTTPRFTIVRDPGFLFGGVMGKVVGAQGPLARLDERFPFHACGKELWIPAGYEWNGNSVPFFLWGWPFHYMPFGLNVASSLVHDFLCDIGTGGSDWLRATMGDAYPAPLPSAEVHWDFYQRNLAWGMPRRKAQLWYQAVRTFGPRWK